MNEKNEREKWRTTLERMTRHLPEGREDYKAIRSLLSHDEEMVTVESLKSKVIEKFCKMRGCHNRYGECNATTKGIYCCPHYAELYELLESIVAKIKENR